MSFNRQATAMSERGSRYSVFKDNIKYQYLTGKQPFNIRILPALDPNNPDTGTSYLPCIDPEGKLTDWGTYIMVARFMGHEGAQRKDILSLRTFDDNAACPLYRIHDAVKSDIATWGYLIGEGVQPVPGGKFIPRPLARVSPMLLVNIFDINKPQDGVHLGVMPNSVASRLVHSSNGLVFARNTAAGIEDMLAKHYLYAYANGDITCPNGGPVFTICKGNDKGDFSAYTIQVAIDSTRNVMRHPMTTLHLAQRINLTDRESFLDRPEPEDIVNDLVRLFNRRSPRGYHEYALLRAAFPEFNIPEPPAAPAAISTVQGASFSPPGGGGGFAASPASTFGGGSPVPHTPPAAGAPIPGAVPPGGYPTQPQAFSGAPVAQPAATPPPVVVPPGVQPGTSPIQPPTQAQPTPQQPVQQPEAAPEPTQPPAQQGYDPVAAAPVGGVVLPGDPIKPPAGGWASMADNVDNV